MKSPLPNFTDSEWSALPVTERALRVAAYQCDVLHAKEIGGNNGGPFCRRYLASVNLAEGYPWCAAFVTYCLKIAGWTDFPDNPAAVVSWVEWARHAGRLVSTPARGRLFYWLDTPTTGHMGFVVAPGLLLRTIEGNTSSGILGSQRDGDGVYRRARLQTKSLKFIDLS